MLPYDFKARRETAVKCEDRGDLPDRQTPGRRRRRRALLEALALRYRTTDRTAEFSVAAPMDLSGLDMPLTG